MDENLGDVFRSKKIISNARSIASALQRVAVAEVLATIAERGKRDLFFLAKEILGYRDMEESVHGPVCRFFVQKDPLKPFGEQSRRKNRALFDPRSHYKTSMTMADTIQWVLCFPNITYLKMSGSDRLTLRIVQEMKQHFEQNSVFREVYPEYCPPDGITKWGQAASFIVPNRTVFRREPTVSMSTVNSVKASAHYDIRDGDDIVNEDNSRTKTSLQQTIIDWKHTRPLVNPGGYTQFTDTRYDFSDCGGDIIESNPPIGPVDDLDGFGFSYEGTDWNIFCRQCWKSTENGRVMLFPQKFRGDEEDNPNKENLDAIQREDPYLFSCQYLNNPAPSGTQSFPRDLLLQQTILRSNIPANVTLFMAWYLGFNANDLTDPAAGIVGGFSPEGTMYVVDCFRGLWSTERIIDAIFTAHRKWYLRRIGLDDKNAPILLGPGIESKMREQRLFLPVEYLPIKQSEDLRMKSVESLVPLLMSGRLYFAADMPCYDQMLMEFTRFGKYRYAGIPYAVATLAQHFRGAYERMINQTSQVEPADVNVAAQHYGMFDDMATNVDDSQELSAGLVG